MNKFELEELTDIRDTLAKDLDAWVKWHTIKGRRDMGLVWEALSMVIRWKTKQFAEEASREVQSNTISSESGSPTRPK